ncbi:MAG TPA: RibD family protein [Steroidobacteraceae bacterium]|nr:RibD family protein [Steroidobacteraceae bacterium]
MTPPSLASRSAAGNGPDSGLPGTGVLDAWALVRGAALAVRNGLDVSRPARYVLDDGAALVEASADGRRALLAWQPEQGWVSLLAPDDPRRELVELYLPICGAHASKPIAVGHLGQSLDGFIATHSGDSNFVTGPANILHLHRMRALCDAVVVGAGTVASDDPRLTTRLVAGRNPLRVVIDPDCRLDATHGVFQDREAPTLRICGRGARPNGKPQEEILELDCVEQGGNGHTLDLAALVAQLHARGLYRLFIEGGGVTVSSWLQAGLLDRLQIAVAALLIGDGRPGIRLDGRDQLDQCRRPLTRVYRMGQDMLYDCELRSTAPVAAASLRDELERII